MFPSSSDQSRASRLAASELRAWETTIALRISLQKPLDLANQLPPRTNVNWMKPSDCEELSDKNSYEVQSIALQHLNSMASILSNGQQGRTDNATLKRKASEMITSLDDELDPWDRILQLQNGLQDRWTTVVNKWHSRVSFGSEHAKDRLKAFNQTFWQQIEDKLEADDRPTGEVYDDRVFYATILKSFITSSGFGTEGGLAGSMRAGDLAALRTYRKKAEVERKASKGRKVRYHVHDKLQHFMFPATNPAEAAVGVDSDRLLHSLFQ